MDRFTDRAARLARGRLAVSITLGLAAGWLPVAARAAPPLPESERLFAEARRLMAEKKYDQACPELERSEALDPEIGTEFNLARCYELAGRLASAWRAYATVIEKTHAAGQAGREAVARNVAAALAPRLAHVVIRQAGGAAAGLEVRCDGALLEDGASGEPLPIDPGPHVVEAVTPGGAPWRQAFVVDHDGQRIEVEIPPLASPAPLVSPQSLASPPPPASWPALVGARLALLPAAEAPRAPPPGRVQREIAAVFGGAALLGVGLGTYYGLRASSLSSQSNAVCDTVCPPAGFALREEAQRDGNVATVAFTIAVSLLVEAAVVWFTAPHAGGQSPGR